MAAIYRYYKNKEEIVFDLFEEGLELLQKEIIRASDTGLFWDQKLAAIAMAYRQFSCSQKDHLSLYRHTVETLISSIRF